MGFSHANPPLIMAVRYGDTPLVQKLLKEGANVDERGEHERTALIWAACIGQPDVVRMLIDRGANVNAEDDNGYTPLLIASDACGGLFDIAQTLIEKGANIHHVMHRTGDTVLHNMMWYYAIDVVRLLTQKGVDLEIKNKMGDTPLDLVRSRTAPEVLKLLEEAIAYKKAMEAARQLANDTSPELQRPLIIPPPLKF